MKQCPTCHRHLRAPEARCPFCGAEQRSAPDGSNGLVVTLLLSAMLSACTERDPGVTTGTTDAATTDAATTTTGVTPTTLGPTTTTGPNGTTDATPTTDGSVSNSDPSVDVGDDGCAFYAGCPPDFSLETPCDVFAQDCAPDEKCSAHATNNGSSWDATKCVPVTGTQAPGQPCTAEDGGLSGIDDCQLGAMCWDVDDMGKGTCVALCTGTENAPVCAADFDCAIANEGVLNLCLPACDPLQQDCPAEEVCVAIDDAFVCIFDGSGDTGALNSPCEGFNSCDAGLFCAKPSAAVECMQNAFGCCQPFCDTTKPDPPCPNQDQECIPWFDAMMQDPPPGLENIGFCSIPPP